MTANSTPLFPLAKMSLMRSALLVGATSALAACATPTYPVTMPAATTPAPTAPATAPTPAPIQTAPTPPTAEPPPATTPAPPPAAVQSQALPPPSGASSTPPPPQAETQTAPRSFSPPAYAPPPASTAEQAPRYTPPAPAYARRERVIAGGQVVAANHMYRDYVVQKGDHLDAIARDFQANPETLVETNHIKSPNDIRPGQHLKIPVEKAYVAQSGDTLGAVAQRFGLSPEQLASLNDLSVRDRLRAGDRLALPAEFHDRGPTRINETVATEVAPRYPARQSLVRQSPVRQAGPPANDYLPKSGVYTPGAVDQAINRTPPATPAYAASPPAQSYAYAPRPSSRYPAYTATDGRYAGIAAEPSTGRPVSDAQIAAAGKGRFVWPVRGETLAKFGQQGVGRRNDGLDIKSPEGAPVRAAAAGEVVYAGNQIPGFGNLVLVKHADGWVTAYAHLDHASVQMRQTVAQGQEIGLVGQTGGVAQPELHFEIRYAAAPTDKAKPIDPLLVLPE